MGAINKIALVIVIIGALNWGSIGAFGYDLVAAIGGGPTGVVARVIYIVVGFAGLWTISTLIKMRNHE